MKNKSVKIIMCTRNLEESYEFEPFYLVQPDSKKSDL